MGTREDAGSTLIHALEQVWAAIRARHPEVPDVLVITGAGSGRVPGGLVLGHFAEHRWDVNGDSTHELFVGGEGLGRGAREVLATMLHEASHGLATARGIKDTSRQGRYHNAKFKALAEELGIQVAQHPVIGWSLTTLPDATAELYAAELDQLAVAITVARRAEGGIVWPTGGQGDGDTVKIPPVGGKPTTPTSRNNPVFVCGCETPRKMRMARSVFEQGPITCGACGQDFAEPSEDGSAGPAELPAQVPAGGTLGLAA